MCCPTDGQTTTNINLELEPKSSAFTYAGLVLLYAPNFAELKSAYIFDDETLTVGRGQDCDICIPQQAVSRMHAKILHSNNRWLLQDLAQRGSTLVNGRVVQQATLNSLDDIRIGNAFFKFVSVNAEKYAAYSFDRTSNRGSTATPLQRANLVGGYQIDQLVREIEHIAPQSLCTLILGESGTGKEMFATHLHAHSGRQGMFQAINCAAIPPNLIESELFGYKRGAFSGAQKDQMGLIRSANLGTLFLDEIGDMPLEAQTKLLRVLQSKEVVPVGGTVAEPIDVRIVAATNRDLNLAIKENAFRGDLFARLNEYCIFLPPLRERKEDIYPLCKAFLERYERSNLEISPTVMAALLHYNYPYNVRELEAFIKRGIALCIGSELLPMHMPSALMSVMHDYGKNQSNPSKTPSELPLPVSLSETNISERRRAPSEKTMREAMTRHAGNVASVARELQCDRAQVHRWLKRYNIEPGEYRRM